MIQLFSRVVEQTINQSRLNLPTKHHGGTDNGLTALLTRQAWRQELPCIDGLRKAVKDGAVPEEIGAHGDHNIHRHLMLRCSGKQQGHKSIRFIAVVLLTIAKNLFELVHQQQEIGAFWQGGVV